MSLVQGTGPDDTPEITVSAVAQAGDGSLIEQEPVSDASFVFFRAASAPGLESTFHSALQAGVQTQLGF